jgi:putative tricarboxylic transport membrane protein
VEGLKEIADTEHMSNRPPLWRASSSGDISQAEVENMLRGKDLISGFFFLLVGVFFIINALRLDLGTFSNPGPGLVPLLPGIILFVLSAVLVVKSYMLQEPRDVGDGSVTRLGQSLKWSPGVIITLAAMLVFAVVLQYLGFIVSCSLMMLFLFKFIGKLSWNRSVFGATLSVGLCYLIFQKWLSVQFPLGPWGF